MRPIEEIRKEKIADLWHFAMYLKELDGQTMKLSEIRKWKIDGVDIADAILDVWGKAHRLKQGK